MLRKIALIFVFIIFFSGCSILEHKDQLLTLKSLGDNQAKQEQFLLRQEKKFKLLLSDMNKERLKRGTSRNKILARYGEPISLKEIKDDPDISEQFVYRHPEQFFGSEKVYLFFDRDKKLIEWLYQPAAEQE